MRPSRTLYGLWIFIGDFLVWYGGLFVALVLRHFEIPSSGFYMDHAVPYTIVFFVWVALAYSFGLYDSRMMLLKSRFATVLLQSQFISAAIGVALFYLAPGFIVKPKGTLFLILAVTFVGMFLWRLLGVRNIGLQDRERAIFVASGAFAKKFFGSVNDASYYPLVFAHFCDVGTLAPKQVVDWVRGFVAAGSAGFIVLDLSDERVRAVLPELYGLSLSGVHFMDMHTLFEDISERVSLDVVDDEWLVRNVSRRAHAGYDALKRFMDLLVAVPLFILTVPLFIPIALLVRADGGPAFFIQKRTGKDGRIIRLAKFRTMTAMDAGVLVTEKVDQRVTRVGRWLRALRLDELPQLVAVIVGDLSLIGPRPEAAGLAETFSSNIPYFNVRYFITPGLSGWAQVHHEKPPRTIEETAEKFSYDLYYIKYRSFMLDVKIALKTIYTLVSRAGA